jgi:hypothetical protein
MFKTLANFFKSASADENESTEEITEETTEETSEETSEEVTVSAEAHAELVAAQAALPNLQAALQVANAELNKFGATPKARANFIAETKQLFAWYENVKTIGVPAPKADANAETKTKAAYESEITKEAKKIEANRKK